MFLFGYNLSAIFNSTFTFLIIFYFSVINLIYFVLYALSIKEIYIYIKRIFLGSYDEMFKSGVTPGISIVVPAYNEGSNIIESVNSLLKLKYPRYQVIVVNDGSKDDTLQKLKNEFELIILDYYPDEKIKSKPIKGLYISKFKDKLVVVDKENGGKADSLNAGINASKYPYFCGIDADSILEEEALLRIMRPVIEKPDITIGAGGMIRVVNGSTIERGRVEKECLPTSALALFQIVEYLRAFFIGRAGWGAINSMLIISGAFGVFRKAEVIEAGGYNTENITEDMELVVRLHRKMREMKKKYRIVFVPDSVCWTEVPESYTVLGRQRNRWQRGLTKTMLDNIKMMFNPFYGRIGLFAYPYFFFFELLGPIVEVTGYIFIPIAFYLGVLDIKIFILFLILAHGLGVLLSISGIFIEEFSFRKYSLWRDFWKMMIYGVWENFGYRQLTVYWRLKGIIDYFRKVSAWGAMQRKGFTEAKKQG